MKKIFLILGFSFFCFVQYSQTKTIDQLKDNFNNCETDSCKVHISEELFSLLFDYNIDVAFEFAINNYNYFKSTSFEPGIVLSAIEVSHIYKSYGNYTSGIEVLFEALNLIKDKKNRFVLLMILAEDNRVINNSKDALNYLFEAKNFIIRQKDTLSLSKVNNRIAAVLFELRQCDQAIIYADSSSYFARIKGDSSIIASNYEILGAIKNYNLDYEGSIPLYLQSLEINLEKSDSISIQNNYSNLGFAYYNLKEYKKAEYYLGKSIEICTIKNLQINLVYAMSFLARVYKDTGNYKKAYNLMETILELRIKFFDENRDDEVQALNKKYEAEQRIAEIENQKNLILRRGTLNYVLFFLFLVLAVFSIYFFNSRLKLKRTNQLLNIQKHDLELLNQKMFASNLKIDHQNLEVLRKSNEINLQKEKLTNKTIDLLVLNRELRQTAKLREGLTNMIVHDLKNPISNIINLSENREITFFATEILTMVENILDVQKYEGLVMTLEKQNYSIRKISEEAVKQIDLFAERKNIKIENNLPDELFVFTEVDILLRVFVNFLSNSIKYTPVNGLIKIDYDLNTVEKGFVKINVTDNGIGIKKDKIDVIFNKFKQVVARKTGLARSTGLGLTFCKMAIEAHGGQVDVKSIPNKFTTFSFTIELSEIKSSESKKRKKENIKTSTLSEKDKEYLSQFYHKLAILEIYEISKLKEITEQINEDFSINVKSWKKDITGAIYACNNELYKIILNLIKNGD